jgi:hypothetical protein
MQCQKVADTKILCNYVLIIRVKKMQIHSFAAEVSSKNSGSQDVMTLDGK